MQEKAIVKKVNKDTIELEIDSHGACKDCGVCIIGEDKKNTLTIPRPDFEVHQGDKLKLSLSPQKTVLASLILYIVPLLDMIIGYFVGLFIFKTENMAIITSFVFLAISFIGIRMLDKYIGKNKMTYFEVEK